MRAEGYESRRYARGNGHGRGTHGAPVENLGVKELVGEMLEEGQRLIREEVRLARLELKEEARIAARNAGVIGAGGVVAHGGFFALIATVVLVLATFMPAWVAAGVTAVALLIAGGLMARAGVQRIREVNVNQTVETLKEDKRWASETMRAVRSKRHGTA